MILKRGLLFLLLIFGIFSFSIAGAEVKIFEKEVEAVVGEGQTKEQVESFALQKAKRLAVEEAGTYISSFSVVQNYQLQKDEVTALASGVVRSVPVGLASVRNANDVTYVKIKARIEVDTSTLNRQIEVLMKEKGTLKELEQERKARKELEDQLANLRSFDAKRLEELNAQALAVEREREKQRLIREEQVLKAKGELSKAEADRFAKEKEMQERISRTLAEQEKAKREEALALAAEQDRIRRASLENEQRMNDLSRRAKLSQESWVVIDDGLSLKQAMEEVKGLKAEIANLKNRLEFQYKANTTNLKNAYTQQRALTKAKLPLKPAPKDDFESTSEYNNRIAAYHRQVKDAEAASEETIVKLKKEETLKLAEAKVEFIRQQILVLTPFVERLGTLQKRKFALPEEVITVTLGRFDADKSRFPVDLRYNGTSWSDWWNYDNRTNAKDFYMTRTHLKAEGFFQLEEATNIRKIITAVNVTHLATKEAKEYVLGSPKIFSEIQMFKDYKNEETAARQESKTAAFLINNKEIGNDGRFIAYESGIVQDTKTNLMWSARDNGKDINWSDAKSYCENFQGGGYTDWRMPTLDELAELYDQSIKGKHGYHLTNQITLTRCCPWASESRGFEAAGFSFGNGRRYWNKQSGDIIDRALPVRSNR